MKERRDDMVQKKKKTALRFLIGLGITLLSIAIAALILYRNELRSLMSLKKIDDYGMYQMSYYGDYGFDEFLEVGAKSDADIEAFVTKRLLKGLPIDLGVTGDGCTAFVVKNADGEIMFGRNFDFLYAPSLQLYTTTAIRLVLDKAATVEEAIELLKQYNIYFSGGIECHYLIADASERSVIAEYVNKELCVVEADAAYQIASNFIAYDGLNIGEGFTEFERYDMVQNAIETNGGILEEHQAVQLLSEVGVFNGDTDKLQWSVLYNLTTSNGEIFAHRNTDLITKFYLPVN